MPFINCYYTEEQIKLFLHILDGITRGNDEGIFQCEEPNIKLKIKVEVIE